MLGLGTNKMATPLKPWELKATDPAHGRDGNSRVSGTAGPGMGTSPPPAIPPRSTMTNSECLLNCFCHDTRHGVY